MTARDLRFSMRVSARELTLWQQAAERSGFSTVTGYLRAAAGAAAMLAIARPVETEAAMRASADPRQLELAGTKKKKR